MNYRAIWLSSHLILASSVLPTSALAADSSTHNATPRHEMAPEPLRLPSQLHWIDANAGDSTALRAGTADASDPTLQFLAARVPGILGSAKRQSLRSSPGVDVVQYRQEVGGIEVYGARLTALLDASRAVRAVGGGFSPHTGSAGLPRFTLNSADALLKSLRQYGLAATPPTLIATPQGENRYARLHLAASAQFRADRPIRAKAVWYPANDRLIPAYYAEIVGSRPGAIRPLAEAWLVSAQDGRLLQRRSLIHDVQAYGYRVLAGDDGHPYVDPYGFTNPHPTGRPDGYLPSTLAPMRVLSLSHSGIRTADPWLPDGATHTRGNNVDAFFNAETVVDGECTGEGWGPAFNADEGDFRAVANGPQRFDYTYDADDSVNDYTQCMDDPTAPIPTTSAQLNAKIVQSFYAANWLHDRFYDAGYDEAAGNAQSDNFGRGGIAGDPLLVHAGYYTTFAFTPADGESGSLTLGRNLQSLSKRDVSALDMGVVAHEWTHTMFGRLTESQYDGQPGALNEGTADFVGLFMTVREQDRHAMPGQPEFSAAYAVGAYMNLDYEFRGDTLPPAGSPTNPDNSYYRGIRRYPYSSDLRRNPLTFKHISLDNPVPADSLPFDWKARSLLNAEIHTAGEVWTSALWQCARNVLAAAPPSRFEQTHQQFLAWLVAGLKLFPTDATYTEARTAVLLAIRASSEADYLRCRAGFASRGMGAGALSPPRHSYSLRGVVESFRDSERALNIVDMRLEESAEGDADGVLDRGELGRLTVILRNTGFSPLTAITLAAPPIPGFYDLPERTYVAGIALQPGETTEVPFAIRLRSNRSPLALPIQAFAWDVQHPEAIALNSRAFEVNYDLARTAYVDSAGAAATFASDWSHGFDDFPHGCALYVCTGAQGNDLADVLDWQRVRHNGVWSYVIRDTQLSLGAWLATVPFTVSPTTPLELLLRHDYDFERAAIAPGFGKVEIRVDDGEWQDASTYLVSGSADYRGISAGWRNDVLRFGNAIAGHRVQLRLHANSTSTFAANPVHWAIARVELRGATQPLFSRVQADGQ